VNLKQIKHYSSHFSVRFNCSTGLKQGKRRQIISYGNDWTHDQLSVLRRNTRKEPDFTREQQMHPPKVPSNPNLMYGLGGMQTVFHGWHSQFLPCLVTLQSSCYVSFTFMNQDFEVVVFLPIYARK